MDGMRAAVKLQVISDEYPAVLPKSCIQHGSDGGSYVFLLREKETVLVFGQRLHGLIQLCFCQWVKCSRRLIQDADRLQ